MRKYVPKHYAMALLAVLKDKSQDDKKKILQNFIQTLARHGNLKSLGLILKSVEKQYLSDSGFKKISLDSANPVSRELKDKIKKILGDKSLILEKGNPGLLAGIKILVNDELLVDASAKSQLRKLFRNSS